MYVLKHIPSGRLCDVVSSERKTIVTYETELAARHYLSTCLPTFEKEYEIVPLPIGWFPESVDDDKPLSPTMSA